MITCFIRYTIDPNKLADFEHYARTWMRLIEKYGGLHHGYFVPGESPAGAAFSFAGIGEEGPSNVAVALFSFPDADAYERYRRKVANDPECREETRRRDQTQCFIKYERTFLRRISRD